VLGLQLQALRDKRYKLTIAQPRPARFVGGRAYDYPLGGAKLGSACKSPSSAKTALGFGASRNLVVLQCLEPGFCRPLRSERVEAPDF
jgi:hypothetical protein